MPGQHHQPSSSDPDRQIPSTEQHVQSNSQTPSQIETQQPEEADNPIPPYYAGLSLSEIEQFQEKGQWKDHGEHLILPVPAEFNFHMNVEFLRSSPNECLFTVGEHDVYKALAVGESRPLLRIYEEKQGEIIVQFLGDTAPSSEFERAAVAAYVSDWFDLGIDLLPFYKLASSDALLGHAVESFYGLRNMGIPDLFEALCWGILGQQINIGYAHTLKCRLTEAFGESVEYEGTIYRIFPTAERIAVLEMDDLELMHMTVKKCEYILHAARLVASGELSKEKLLSAGGYREAEKMLTRIRGIGPWTANYVLMRCIRIPSAFPIDDVGLHNVIRHLTGSAAKPTREELLKLSAGWSNWESYATFYLWRVLY